MKSHERAIKKDILRKMTKRKQPLSHVIEELIAISDRYEFEEKYCKFKEYTMEVFVEGKENA